ncbi:glycosyltransferase [Maritimibacter sp. DP07]|uniref:Glycosyltransferase n=1 Tax=Maritimibacter harenae TaxID=2606218 RepID=A0A845M2N4_9RHOB|nr:glycosyltransferase [Maritimibacter harenae]MZR13826.1 glycosyltransferase [Maritimibacter harenae]
MKFTVIVARYAITGVPLAQARLASALAARGHEVDLVIGYVAEGLPVPELDGVTVLNFNRPKARNILFEMMRYLRKTKPDAIFSAEDHLNAIVIVSAILSGSKAKISGSSRVNPFDTYSTKIHSKQWFLKKIMGLIMWRATALTCVSKAMVDQYRTLFRNAPHVCAYNIVDTPAARARIAEEVDHPWFNDPTIPILVAAGQLGPWKGFSDLICAVHIVAQKRPVRLSIFGEGAQRAELQALINQLGMSDSITLEGHVDNPLKYFANANVFVLSSLLEGMPNVLIEAMMAGCTPVATDCPTGPREILESGRYGYLVSVQDPQALAAGIESALSKPVPAEVLAEAIKPFQEDAVLTEHFRLLGI